MLIVKEGFAGFAIKTPIKQRNIPKKSCKSIPVILTAKIAPKIAPKHIPGENQRTIGQTTSPRLWCAKIELIEVITIVANEVPTAI